MAALTLTGPVGYMAGSEQINSGPFVGHLESSNYVLRYSFKTPSSGYITSLAFSTTFRHYSGDAGTTFNVRVKVTKSATSHINAGISTTDYDTTISLSGTADASKSCTITGLWLEPNQTYYLYLFPGTQYFLKFCYDNSGNDYGSLSYDSIVLTYALSVSAGTGSTITVKRTSSPSGSTGSLSNGATIYTGDVLTITFGASTGYNLGTHTVNGSTFTSGGTHTVNAAVSVVSTASLKTFKLSISAGTGSTISVKRSGTTLSNGATITYGDVLTITFGASTGYNLGTHTVNGSTFTSGGTYTVAAAVAVVSTAAVKTFTLSISAGTGSTITVTRTKSPLQGAGTGKLANGATIYYNDVLSITFDGSALYEILTGTVNGSEFASGGSYTVTGAVVVVTTTRMLGFVYLTVGGVLKKFRIIIYHNSKWVKYRPVILHSDTDISAIGIGDAIVITTSLPVKTDGDTIIIGGA